MSVSVVIEKGVAEVYIDHPPVNAPDSAGWNKIAETITTLGKKDKVQCIILASKGKGFCAGADIKELAADGSLITQVNAGCWNAFAAIHDCFVPVVAACHGYVLGGGIGLAGYLHGDLVRGAVAYTGGETGRRPVDKLDSSLPHDDIVGRAQPELAVTRIRLRQVGERILRVLDGFDDLVGEQGRHAGIQSVP